MKKRNNLCSALVRVRKKYDTPMRVPTHRNEYNRKIECVYLLSKTYNRKSLIFCTRTMAKQRVSRGIMYDLNEMERLHSQLRLLDSFHLLTACQHIKNDNELTANCIKKWVVPI